MHTSFVGQDLVDLQQATAKRVRDLSVSMGERNVRNDRSYENLCRAREYIVEAMRKAGWVVRRKTYLAKGRRVDNIECERPDASLLGPALVLGAHYDSARGSPGANDNATGIACLLAVGRLLASYPRCPVRLVAFTNEEPPHTRTPTMGSWVYARECSRQGRPLLGMISLETLAAKRTRTPRTPALFAVGNIESRELARRLAASMRAHRALDVRALVAPGFLPLVRSSDHWSFWKQGYPAVMLTAGGPLTYPHYHRPTDTLENTNVQHLAEIAMALADATTDLTE